MEQYAGQWLYLDAENKAELPRENRPGLNCTLGRDVVIGRRVWDVQSNVCVAVGPVDASAFRSLLPGGHARGPLCEMIRLYLGLEFDAEVRVVLQPDAVPWTGARLRRAQRPAARLEHVGSHAQLREAGR